MEKGIRCALAALIMAGLAGCPRATIDPPAAARPLVQGATAHFKMPATSDGATPLLLSQVGGFKDLAKLTPAAGLVPYEINVSFWSDGAKKHRWIALPPGKQIEFSAHGEWRFPVGTVFVKHFEWPAGPSEPQRRIETRVLVCGADGGVVGASYKWRSDGSDADLVTEPITTSINAEGNPPRAWYFPGTADCRVCHTPAAGGVLGVKTRQLNRPFGQTGENQLITWNRRGFLTSIPKPFDPEQFDKLASSKDASRTVEDRARSYLDVNCSNCHRPGGVAGNFDARYDTPLSHQNLIDGPVLIDLGLDRARVIAPHDVWRSIALARVETSDLTRMPPLAHETVDREGAELLRSWITSMPGLTVLEPPVIETRGGEYRGTLRVVIRHRDPGAAIRYTLDGSAPGMNAALYQGPIELKGPTTLRARAYKEGATRSIVVQETFIVND
jgi:uncharacterized repeat protein (TIGR03806 family)